MNTADLARQWEEILPAASAIARDARTLRTVALRLSTDEGYEALRKLERDLDKLDGLRLELNGMHGEVEGAAERVRQWLAGEWSHRSAAIRDELQEWFEQRGAPLEERGGDLYRFPFAVRIDARADRASLLHAGELVKGNVPLSVDRVFREWDKARDRLERDATAPDRFADVLREAYGVVLRLRKEARPGSRARMPDVHFQAFVKRQTAHVRADPRRGRVKEYPRYQFAWDLGQLVEYGLPEDIELFEASRSASEGRTTSLLVDLRDGGAQVYGDIRVASTDE